MASLKKDHTEESSSSGNENEKAQLAAQESEASYVISIENKFRGLEVKARKFEMAVMHLLEKKETIEKLNPLNFKKRAFENISNPKTTQILNPRSENLSLNSPFVGSSYLDLIRFLTKFFVSYLNGLILVVNETYLEKQLENHPFDSLAVKCACAVAFPVAMSVLGRPTYHLKENTFYLDLKNCLAKTYHSPHIITLWGLAACIYLEIGHGEVSIISLSVVKGTRLLKLLGIVRDETLDELYEGTELSLSKSLLWNFWSNAISLDETINQEVNDIVHLHDFTPKHFSTINLFICSSKSKNNFNIKIMQIFNYQVFREITSLQKHLFNPSKTKEELFESGLMILSKKISAFSSIKDWVNALCNNDHRVFSERFFFCKVSIVVGYYAQYILLINFLSSFPKEIAQRLEDISGLPCILTFCEKLLLILQIAESHGQRKFSKKDPCFIHSFTIAYAIPYFYTALLLLENYTCRGSQILYQCLEKLKRIAPIWSTVHDWILIIVTKRKLPTTYNSPPLTFGHSKF